MRRFVPERFGLNLSRSSCLNYLHRLGFSYKRPRKRLVKADEAIWGWAREEATGNLCLGSRAAAQERAGNFLAGLACRRDEVSRRCRTVLQSRAGALLRDSQPDSLRPANAHPSLALV